MNAPSASGPSRSTKVSSTTFDRVVCPHCQARFRQIQTQSGTSCKCPRCSRTVVVARLGLPGAGVHPVKADSGRKELSRGQILVAVAGAIVGSLLTTTPILSWLGGKTTASAEAAIPPAVVQPPAPQAAVVSPVSEGTASAEVTAAFVDKETAPAKETEPFDKWLAPDQTYPRRRVVGVEVNGKIDGEVRSLDSKGRLITSENYRDGIRIGLRTDYYPGGAKFADYTYDDTGLPQGVSRRWFENGRVAQEMYFKDGVAHGVMTMYYPNGQMSQVGTIVEGKAQGPRKHYLPDGRLFGVSTMKDGQVVRDSVVLRITEQEAEEVGARARWAPRLKSYWE